FSTIGRASIDEESSYHAGRSPGEECSQTAVLCREDQLLLRFSGEGSRQLKLNRASLAKQGGESAGPRFLTSCSSTCRSTCMMRDLKSPAPISDRGLFRAIFQCSPPVYKL